MFILKKFMPAPTFTLTGKGFVKSLCIFLLTILVLSCSGEEEQSTEEIVNDLLNQSREDQEQMEEADFDEDGAPNNVDNCPTDPNRDQRDTDLDGRGDECDSVNDLDLDEDGVLAMFDNCPHVSNADQANIDNDALGDACDSIDNSQDLDGDGIADSIDTDDDGDTIADGLDNCPRVPNFHQDNFNGDALGDRCQDFDGDGIRDWVDNCPEIGPGNLTDTDGDGMGNVCDDDDDNDTFLDSSDNCPLVENPLQSNLDADILGDACDPDDDNDGRVDPLDNCPEDPNPDQADRDHDSLGDACDSVDDVRTTNEVAFNHAVRTGAPFTQPEEQSPMQVGSTTSTMERGEDGQMYRCSVRRYSAAAGYNQLFLLDPTTSIIFPGSIIRGETIADGRYIPITGGSRRPMNISVNILGAQDSVRRTIESPSLSTVRDGITNIVSGVGSEPPANGQLTLSTVYSNEQFGLNFGIDVDATITPNISIALGTDFSIATSNNEHRYMTRFAQRYFTVDIDPPQDPSDFFEEFPTIQGNSIPVYISSVTYGRSLFFEMVSGRSQLDIEAALRASLMSTRVNISSELSTQYQEVYEESEVRVTTLGGDGSIGSSITSSDDIRTYLEEGGRSHSNGVPLSYTLRFLSDNSIAQVNLASEYNVRECDLVLPPEDNTLRLQLIGVRSSNNDGGHNDYEVFGNVRVRYSRSPVGSTIGSCTIPEGSGATLYERSRDSALTSIGSQWVDITSYNFRGEYDVPQFVIDENLPIEFCFRLTERDGFFGFGTESGSSDDDFTYSTRLSLSEALRISTSTSMPLVLRDTDGGSFIDFQVIRYEP